MRSDRSTSKPPPTTAGFIKELSQNKPQTLFRVKDIVIVLLRHDYVTQRGEGVNPGLRYILKGREGVKKSTLTLHNV